MQYLSIHGVLAIGALLVLNLAQAQKHPPNVPGANLPDIAGVLPWSQLEKVGTYKAGDGRLLPKYPDNVLALDNRQVLLQGFMMPLEAGAKQSHFLLTVTTPGCAYCLPAGPEGIVDINATTPIKFTYKPIVLSGQMHVLKSDPMGLYYRLSAATPVVP